MIIWSGLGFLVAVVGFGCVLGAEFLTEAAFNDDQYFQSHGWPMLVAFLVAGAIVWFLGRYLNDKGTRRLIDPETNQEVTLKSNHSFFFIPMQYWGAIFVVLGIVLQFVEIKEDATL